MLRLVVLVVLLWIAFEVALRWVRYLLEARRKAEVSGAPKAVSRGGTLMPCPVCGTHFPRPAEGGPEVGYCSESCARTARSGPS